MKVRIASAEFAPADEVAVCRLHLDDGMPAGDGLLVPAALSTLIAQLVTDELRGADARAAPAHYERLRAATAGGGFDAARAVAALDCALWQSKARSAGEPLWRMLGGTPDRPPSHVALPADADVSDSIERMTARRFAAACLPLGGDARADRDKLAAYRNALARHAHDPVLMIAIGNDVAPETAISTIRALEADFDIALADCHGLAAHPAGWVDMPDDVAAAVCGGAGLATLAEFLPLFRARAIDAARVDIELTGISGAIQLSEAAYGLELPILLVETRNAVAVALATAVPNCMSVEIPWSVAMRGEGQARP